MSRAESLRSVKAPYDVANPPAGVRLVLGTVATRLAVTITDMSDATGISRTAIAGLLTNTWPVKTEAQQIRSALLELMAERGATDDELATLFHARGHHQADGVPRLAGTTSSRPGQVPPAPTTHKPASPGGEPEDEDMLPMKAVLSPAARRHFKLLANPFDGQVRNDAQMFRGAEYDYVAEAAWQCAQTSGFVAIVGESGAGKTTVLEDLEARLEREQRRLLVFKPSVLGMEESERKGHTLKSADILHAIIAVLAPDQPVPVTMQARTLRARKLLSASASMGTDHLLVVEEAHCMPDATLKHLKRLHEQRDGRRSLLGILLLAQPELKGRLLRGTLDGSLREVAQRCELVELLPLASDIKPYLQTRATAVGVDINRLITDDGVAALLDRLAIKDAKKAVSLAYPLAVNNLMIRALNKAADIGAPVVDAGVVKVA
ncbi:MAG: AAA family ATPase [Rubrivivax sp.]|nr:AAA family ATPase [Rubrivivax sp.]